MRKLDRLIENHDWVRIPVVIFLLGIISLELSSLTALITYIANFANAHMWHPVFVAFPVFVGLVGAGVIIITGSFLISIIVEY